MRRAASQRRAGDLAAARASLERALRIEPRNPHLWNRLAHLSLLQRAFARAEQFAAKANVLAQGDPALRADDWAVIAQARRAQGDLAGARAAARRARVVE
jgi:Tfp pilus assembly protein PilF